MKIKTLTMEPIETPTSAVGKIYYNSTENRIRYYDGTSWSVM